jgi:hypothetical protein
MESIYNNDTTFITVQVDDHNGTHVLDTEGRTK